MHDVLIASVLFVPAGVANATPPLLTKWFGEGRPIDAGREWRGRPLLGAHKTWQGLIGGSCAGTLAFVVQRAISATDLPLLFGIAISVGALTGDLVKSFVKRRLAIAPGKTWFPIDQLDYVVGALIASAPFIRLTPSQVAGVLAVYFLLHLAVSAIGFVIGVRPAPI